MRLEQHLRHERFGAVRIHELQRVVELDSGRHAPGPSGGTEVVADEEIRAVMRELVIVVPCMDEPRRVIEGVLAGIPHDCLIVLVSNSARHRFATEVGSVDEFCRLTGRAAVVVHQRDPGLAAAMRTAGMPELLGDDGLVRTGKGEAMLIGTAIAAMSGRAYVGSVDADNHVPGAVHEYVTAYAAGLRLADGPYAMVRIPRHPRPVVRDGRLFLDRRGGGAEVTNHFLNRVLAAHTGLVTEAIATGDAGERALSLPLALRLRVAGGLAGEAHEYADLFDQFGRPGAEAVSVLQIEMRDSRSHDDVGDERGPGRWSEALGVLYHSPVTPPAVRAEIADFLAARDVEPAPGWIYPPLGGLAFDLLKDVLTREAGTFREIDGRPEQDGPILPNPLGLAVGRAPVPEIDDEPVPIDTVLD
ncbi:mannosyl-3-phosphoglycerate synthase [Catenuloplanes nepalensis]|uniref:Mannosyl-3-phosphoglycerate synthase n=1 Tax=Catenuloplanes nepalensis TaxID=587533 RepID=A0ABT9N0P4_9ACTN|nr:mannosyl-3-phosphoglycerate synthase [Catenuloplanes nepalensis]MDP9797264.1 mannosyl-3-phosphoglycerate synthase [Catenuloplanes nepalensis]